MKKWFLLIVLGGMFSIAHATPLTATEVFQVGTKLVDPNTFLINWQVKPGYFLYADRIHLTEQANTIIHLGNIRFPTPLKKMDKQGKNYSVYRNKLSLPVAILGQHPGETILTLHFQGCADNGFCYPPETRQLKLAIDDKLALSQVNLEPLSEQLTEKQAVKIESESNSVEAVFNQHWFIVILSFMGLGLLLSMTPCILPMIPVLSGIIMGHGKNLSTRKAFLLSLSYVLSMSVTYAIVGAVIASLSANLQLVMQSTWVILLFSLIFVLLALSMFGFYELRLPVSWQAKLANANRNQSGGHYLGAAIMGCLSILILSPCVTPPLIGALGYIAQSGNILLGSLALFFLSFGMGIPLLLIGTSAGKWLPKTGMWMNAVKAFFGVMLLAVAIYLLERILPGPITMILWASLLIFAGIFCGALTRSSTKWAMFSQGVGLILLVYGLLVLIGASMGNSNPLQPLTKSEMMSSAQSKSPNAVKTIDQLNLAINEARGKPILLDFYADWCASCKFMEATTFKNTKVKQALEDFIVIKVDITANNKQEKALLKQFKVVAPPTFLFLNNEGNEQDHLRLVGEVSAKKLLQHLNNARADASN